MWRFLFSLFVFFLMPFLGSVFTLEVKAQEEIQTFSIDSSYDLYARKTIEATLVRDDRSLYFYVEKSWWDSRSREEQNTIRIALAELGLEFQRHIYPVLTSTFGSEPKPGIDKDERITVLIHQMGGEAGGYFRIDDVYERLQSPGSNEREMVYLNSKYIGGLEIKSFLAHEFTHLITINQKDLLRKVTEEIWLNEARAEYAPTLLGYDDGYKGSNLERRVRDFLAKPSDSFIDWVNGKGDYAAANVFTQYLVDQYGVNILADSLKSSLVGIPSLNEALQKNGFQKDFSEIFTDWAITVLVNDCNLGEKYCYKNKNLQNLRITPTFYYIPRAQTIFSTYHTVPYWGASLHRLVGGEQKLTLEFGGSDSGDFEVPYVLCDVTESCLVRFFALDEDQKGIISFSDFATQYSSLTIIPFSKSRGSEPISKENPFSWKVTVERGLGAEEDAEIIPQLLARLAELQEQVRQLQMRLAVLRGSSPYPVGQSEQNEFSCGRFDADLSFGMRNEDVRCLQEFLVSQGESIYPEGLVTGNFLSLTRQAVLRFQEKYAPEILAPLGLDKGTGYVGQVTRNKMNSLLEFSTATSI